MGSNFVTFTSRIGLAADCNVVQIGLMPLGLLLSPLIAGKMRGVVP